MKIMVAMQTIVDNADRKPLNYAVNYAKHALTMKKGSEAFRAQLEYVRSNIVYWRGDLAKQVRQSISDELSR